MSQLVPSTRPTDETACGLWRTPNAHVVDAKSSVVKLEGRKPSDPQVGLADQVAALWPTPCARDHMPPHTPEYIAEKKALGHGMSILPDYVAMAMWQTPVADDSVNRTAGKFNSRGEPKLSAEVKLVQWPTPTATDANRGMTPPRPQDTGVPLNQAVALQTGVAPDGSQGMTGKPAGSLNPEFVSWLMGFSDAWLLCAPDSKAEPRTRKRSTGTAARVHSKRSETPSSRKSQRK
ncbi:hypothetical protein [uncultured Stenotrophomonas sp.]|uniref:hypothetical protein n=1 Tax=uncultured Stenotrophomonas sp. TaxID=165438 RepID=UPI0025841EB1|nr:hypothetical protein [uncultured Stenotrophomonas sp.]